MASKRGVGILEKLREFMKNPDIVGKTPLGAYIIPSGDAHNSEYIAPCDGRRAFISGFTGSAGVAVVTLNHAALWTDGRYFLQASQQLYDTWTLMKDGLPDTPSQSEWLGKVLPKGSNIGVDPSLITAAGWNPLGQELEEDGLKLVQISKNLVDLVWEDRPASPRQPIFIQPLEYTGVDWQTKVKLIQTKLKQKKAGALVISALDEVAWLFNLRGSDIEFNPVFFAYAIITKQKAMLFLDEDRLSGDVKKHLQTGSEFALFPYNSVQGELSKVVESTGEEKIWISDKTSYKLFSTVPKNKRLNKLTPTCELKAIKNSVEAAGMRKAHIKDAVALCCYLEWLEKNIPVPGTSIDECQGADKLEEFRRQQDKFVSLSFDTISSIGANGSIIHYKPEPQTAGKINCDEIYLCDSGAQYVDGTTDVTRTIHLGTPTEHQKECFTQVLKGHIALATQCFPPVIKGSRLDTLARMHLWNSGLDYLHGTGHGVGAFLNVHEGPCGISYKSNPNEVVLEPGMILSNEPGYYEDGKFGIRIESLVEVVKAKTQHNFLNKTFLTFDTITLVPIQRKMIKLDMLTTEELAWLNSYHEKCRAQVGEEMKNQGRKETLEWLMRETEPIS